MDTRFETMDCHASTSALARNDGKRGFFTQDSRSCGGALCDSKNLLKKPAAAAPCTASLVLGVGVTFGGNDCSQIFRNARMLTQDRIY